VCTNETHVPLDFKITAFYKYVRYLLYFGGILGLCATPVMTISHLVFVIFLTAYTIIGAMFEEKDLMKEFGEQYQAYKKKTPMLIPFSKRYHISYHYYPRKEIEVWF
jgi:methanethiol S-methyltransferase